MKKLIPAYVISFVFMFMLCLYEPITMYMLNFHDFWFDISIILKPLLMVFFGLFIGISVLFTAIYFINKKFSKKLTFYNVTLIILFVVFLCTYIQGNYMIGNLPSLDGTDVDWSKYNKESIISVVMWIVVIAGTVFACIKFKMENVIKTTTFISLALFVMLMSSMIASIRPHSWDNKIMTVSTTKNYSTASTDKNFVIFLLDAVDSVLFDEVMTETKQTGIFEDFTYYKDTSSAYAYTRDSIPFILSGTWNENKTDFLKYYNDALDNSSFIDALKENNYNINIYENDLKWTTDKADVVSNLVKLDKSINTSDYLKQQSKYVLFKYLPYPLKKYTKIEDLDFNSSKIYDGYSLFNWSDRNNYNAIKENDIETTNEKMFKFIHIEGSHVPFNLNENVEKINNGTYQEKIKACLTIINTYLDKLKEAGVYDNSVIIIMADHGYSLAKNYVERTNPILFIKGVDEHHDMIRSDIPVSYADLKDAYTELINGSKSEELFSNISSPRERRVMLYKYLKENHMVEYVQKGKAWDEDTLVPTGKEFNR